MATGTILVVDDSSELRALYCDLLRASDIDAVAVPNGLAALEFLRSRPAPSVILLDLNMPVMDGLTFRRHQLAEPRLARIPVVVVSATYVDSAAEWVGVPLLRKPVDLQELLAAIRRSA